MERNLDGARPRGHDREAGAASESTNRPLRSAAGAMSEVI
jgi:hypothetical protein